MTPEGARGRWERFVAWSTLTLGILLFIGETVHGFLYGGTPLNLTIDYIAAGLGCYAGWQSLRRAQGAAGLLFGAWSYALCDVYRALWWRAESYWGTAQSIPSREPFAVFIVLSIMGGLTLFFFVASLILAHPRGERVG